MEVKKITQEEFSNFLNNYNDMYHYKHDVEYYENKKKTVDAYLLGLFKDDSLIGVSSLSTYQVLKKFKSIDTHDGPLLKDFSYETFEYFVKEIEKFAKEKGAVSITFNPYIVYQMRDSEGNIIEDHPKNHKDINQLFTILGFTHQGFTKKISIDHPVRYQSVVDISGSLDDILKNMNKSTRYNTHQTEKLPLTLKQLKTKEDFDKFIEIYKETEERLGFDQIPETSIRNVLSMKPEKTFVVMSQINLDEYLNDLENEVEQLTSEINEVTSKEKMSNGDKKRVNQKKQVLNSRKKKINEVLKHKEKYGSHIDISVGTYVFNNNEMVYLYSGSRPEHNQFYGTNFVTWKMIKKAKELGLERFNMFGITGNFHEDASDYGVFKFKQGYNAHIEELPGTFIKVFKPIVFNAQKVINKVRK